MRVLGITLCVVGGLLLVVSLLADTMKIGHAPLFFGWKQVAGVVSGTVMFLLGFILCLPEAEKADSEPNHPA